MQEYTIQRFKEEADLFGDGGEGGSNISTGKLNEEGIDKDNFVRWCHQIW